MTLIIYAHPGTPGHCPHILKSVKAYHKEHGIPYEVVDLYALGYDPVLKESEHYTSGNYAVSRQNRAFQKKISKEKAFIFIYPVWWNGPPAILKGFLDRVFTPRWGFRFNRWGIPRRLLKGKKAQLFTTSGSPGFIFRTWLFSGAVHEVATNTLAFCGFRTRSCHFGSSKSCTEERKCRIDRKVPRVLRRFYRWV